MKTKAICSFFVLFAIVAVMVSTTPAAFADHSEVTIVSVEGSGFSQDCVADGCYTPGTATVDVGGTVIMTNADGGGIHTFTSGTVDGFTPSPDGAFDSSILNANESFEWVPDTTGEYPYYCMLHTWMVGSITVQEAEAEEETHEEETHDEEVMEETHDEEVMEETMMEDVELMVTITDSAVLGGTQIDLEFSELHVNYDITATQNNEVVYEETGQHSMELTASHQIDAVGSDESPIDVEIVSLGIGAPGAEDDWTGPTGSVATTQVVPEFGTVAMMILVVAIISIVAVTTKSRVIPRF